MGVVDGVGIKYSVVPSSVVTVTLYPGIGTSVGVISAVKVHALNVIPEATANTSRNNRTSYLLFFFLLPKTKANTPSGPSIAPVGSNGR